MAAHLTAPGKDTHVAHDKYGTDLTETNSALRPPSANGVKDTSALSQTPMPPLDDVTIARARMTVRAHATGPDDAQALLSTLGLSEVAAPEEVLASA